jgi:hypothetical protein
MGAARETETIARDAAMAAKLAGWDRVRQKPSGVMWTMTRCPPN